MRIDPAGFPFVAIAALPAIVATFFAPVPVAIALLVLPIAVMLFFRDPDRSVPRDRLIVLAPADGRVTYAGPARPEEAPPGRWLQITIFLSLFDVHINRTPVPGRVTRVEYVPGSAVPAYRPDAHRNEHSEIWLDHDGTVVVTRQVVGVLARRVVCRVSAGQQLDAGARIGLMKFGSRMDVFVPPTAQLTVSQGQPVRAGETIIARLASDPA
ncbi:MAG TPA: phosphatidylserine decarboxylase [Vicinamibacterales bacterium]|nr:phosphatidylserine decarboxylase [Vicinamibacterales bacterium]